LTSKRQIFTTKQAADLLGVSLPTVVNWIKQGLIAAYKTPGGHRRITNASLSSFMLKNGYPAEGLQLVAPSKNRQVLLLTKEHDLGELVKEWLEFKLNVKTTIATSLFQSGVAIGRQPPLAFIIDTTTVQIQIKDTMRKLSSISGCRDTAVVLIAGPIGIPDTPSGTTVLRQPLNLDALKTTVSNIIEERLS
jgi:excisionase family DNA binding protein